MLTIMAMFGLVCGVSLAAKKVEKKKSTRRNIEWTSLFDGKKVEGWKNPYAWGEVSVVDGEIHLKADKKFFLVTEKEYSDFVFEGEINLPVGKANSGFMFRCHVEKNKVFGYQAEVDGAERRWSGGLYDEGRRGWLWPSQTGRTKDAKALANEATSKAHFATEKVKNALKRDGWNKYRITCIGHKIKIQVNGVTTTEFEDEMDAKGPIGIQHHGEKGQIYRFRNLRIHEIKRPQTTKGQESKYHVAIIQAAGYLPDTKPPEGTDAITHATTKVVNTYIITSAIVDQLAAKGIEVQVIDYSACDDLKCLYPTENNGKKQVVDVVVFAGPAENSKQQKKILELFPQLEEVVKRSPHIICTSIVPAWYPETKGQEACTYSDNCFKKAGAKTVRGISLLTPRKDNPGVSKENMEKVLNKFADDLISAMQ